MTEIMRKMLLSVAVAVIAAMALTSCDIEISSDDGGNPEEHRAQIANTRWQLAEVMNHNNEWVLPDFYVGLDIPELSFGYSDSYYMKIATRADRTDVTHINGKYDIKSDFSINMTNECYQGIAFTLKVTSLNGNILEGEFIIWGQEQRTYETASDGVTTTYNPRRYTIRMKRIDK